MHLIIEIFFGLASLLLIASMVYDWNRMNEPEDWDEMEFMPNDPLW